MNLIRPIVNRARTAPSHAAVVESGRTITYGELATLIRRTAGHLVALGVRPGDRVGLCLKDTWAHLVVLLATGYAGGVAVPMDWRARAAEQTRIADSLALKLAFVEPDATPATECPAIGIDEAWERAVAGAHPHDAAPDDWDAPLLITATSGTTGIPKFSQGTHLNYFFRTSFVPGLETVRPGARCLVTMPLCFSGGQVNCLTHLLRGDTVILASPLFTAAEFVETVAKHGVAQASVVPSTARQLLQLAGAGGWLLPRLDYFSVAGAPLSAAEKLQIAEKITPNFYERYGAAAIAGISALRPADLPRHAASVGQPNPLVEVEVVDHDDRPLPAGVTGRLRARGPALGTPLLGDAASDEYRHGWYYPGELAGLDERGYITIAGRSSDVIMRSGAKIHPAEVEAVLQSHADVLEAAVLGRRNAGREETVVACVVARRFMAPGELLAHCRARLTPYKVPQEVRVVDSLPKLASGKVDKLELARRIT